MSKRPIGNTVESAGIDAPLDRRPGVPMETKPPHPASGAHWARPSQQESTVEILKRPDLPHLTATYGTAQPPHGLSGSLRRYAYTIPDHKPGHWAVLLMADRVDVLETSAAEFIRRRPIAIVAGVVLLVGGALAFSIRSTRRRSRRRLALR